MDWNQKISYNYYFYFTLVVECFKKWIVGDHMTGYYIKAIIKGALCTVVSDDS